MERTEHMTVRGEKHMNLSWLFHCRYVCHASRLLNSNGHVLLEPLLQGPLEQATTPWQSSSACHITSPDHCKQPAAETESGKGEPHIKKYQAFIEGPSVRAVGEKHLSIFRSGQRRERITSGGAGQNV